MIILLILVMAGLAIALCNPRRRRFRRYFTATAELPRRRLADAILARERPNLYNTQPRYGSGKLKVLHACSESAGDAPLPPYFVIRPLEDWVNNVDQFIHRNRAHTQDVFDDVLIPRAEPTVLLENESAAAYTARRDVISPILRLLSKALFFNNDEDDDGIDTTPMLLRSSSERTYRFKYRRLKAVILSLVEKRWALRIIDKRKELRPDMTFHRCLNSSLSAYNEITTDDPIYKEFFRLFAFLEFKDPHAFKSEYFVQLMDRQPPTAQHATVGLTDANRSRLHLLLPVGAREFPDDALFKAINLQLVAYALLSRIPFAAMWNQNVLYLAFFPMMKIKKNESAQWKEGPGPIMYVTMIVDPSDLIVGLVGYMLRLFKSSIERYDM